MTMVDKLMLYVGSHFGTDAPTAHKPRKTKVFIVPRQKRQEFVVALAHHGSFTRTIE